MSSGTMERILRLMAEKRASDVYLTAHAPAMSTTGQAVSKIHGNESVVSPIEMCRPLRRTSGLSSRNVPSRFVSTSYDGFSLDACGSVVDTR